MKIQWKFRRGYLPCFVQSVAESVQQLLVSRFENPLGLNCFWLKIKFPADETTVQIFAEYPPVSVTTVSSAGNPACLQNRFGNRYIICQCIYC
jgi:hypothetical protein